MVCIVCALQHGTLLHQVCQLAGHNAHALSVIKYLVQRGFSITHARTRVGAGRSDKPQLHQPEKLP